MKSRVLFTFFAILLMPFAYGQKQIQSYAIQEFDSLSYFKFDSTYYHWSNQENDHTLYSWFMDIYIHLTPFYEEMLLDKYDRTSNYKWKADSNVYINFLNINQLMNTNGQVVKSTWTYLDTGFILNNKETRYLYNSNGDVTKESRFIWMDSLGWTMDIETIKSYNLNNQLDTVWSYGHDGAKWLNSNLLTYIYSNGNLVEKYIQTTSTPGQGVLNWQKNTYSQDTLTNTTTGLLQKWKNEWRDEQELKSYFNHSGQLDSMISTHSVTNILKRKVKKVYTYNNYGISEVIESKQDFFNPYSPMRRYLVNYSNFGNDVTVIEQHHDSIGWSVGPYCVKYTYHFAPNVGIEENLTSFHYKIYPNPTTNQITISSTESRVNQIRIVDLSGKVVFENKSALNSNEVTIPVHQLYNGTYILTVTSNGQQKSQKIVVSQ